MTDEELKKLTYEEMLELPFEELGLSERTLRQLKRAGKNCLSELIAPTPEDWMGVRNLGRKALDDVSRRLKELGYEIGGKKKSISEMKIFDNPGKKKCEELRKIRVEVAAANGIEYKPVECNHQGPCMGTCPACDAELSYLTEEIARKEKNGDNVLLTGISDIAREDNLKSGDESERGPRDSGYLEMPSRNS